MTLVPLPIFGEPVEGVPEEPNKEDDKRWRVKAMRLGEWKGWMLDQMATAGARAVRKFDCIAERLTSA